MRSINLKVCYIIYSEEIWSPIIKRQVLELLQTIVKSEKDIKIRLLYIYPWYWNFLKKEKITKLRNEFRNSQIELRLLPVPFPFPLPYFFPKYVKGRGLRPFEPDSPMFFWVLKILLLPVLLKYATVEGYKIFHCRSYPAAASLLPFKKLNKDIKLIFDPRSDFPEENILQSSWTRHSYSFLYWKKQEKMLLKNSTVTICISEVYKQHYKNLYFNFNPKIIPNNVDCVNFHFDTNFRKYFRSKYHLDRAIVFCYLGSMTIGGWHCPYEYVKLIKSFRVIANTHIFLFLVPKISQEQIENVFSENGIHSKEFLIINPEYQDVPKFLSVADYGLFYLKRKKIALGTKIVEYNAVGLPALVNSNVLSAATYVQKYQTGLVIDLSLGDLDIEQTPLKGKDFSHLGNAFRRDKIRETAISLFSNEKAASEYLKVYKGL